LNRLLGPAPRDEKEQASWQIASEPARHPGSDQKREDESDANTKRDAEPENAKDAWLAPDAVRHV
jgi:hypothetical protein